MNNKNSCLKILCLVLIAQMCFLKLNAQFTVYSTFNSQIPGDAVSHIAVDNLGNKWHSTNAFSTLAKFDGSNWTVFNQSNTPLPVQSNANAFATEGDSVWIGIDHVGMTSIDTSVIMFDGNNWHLYTIPFGGATRVYSVCVAADGKKWFGTTIGAIVFDGSNWFQYNTSNSGIPNNLVHVIKQDLNGNFWFGTTTGLAKYDGVNWTTFNTTNSGIIDNNVYSIATSADKIYIGTNAGFSIFDGTSWTSYNSSNSPMPENTVLDVAIDSYGNVWFTTLTIMGGNGGLVKWDGSQFTVYTTLNSNLSDNAVVALATEDCKVWIGTYYGGLCEICSTTGVEDISSSSHLSIFPNPVSDVTQCSMPLAKNNVVAISITDLSGRVIQSQTITAHDSKFKVDLADLSAGVYLMSATSGDVKVIGKVVKK